MRVLIFNVKYSPNLGDGVLAECLEHNLRQCGPDIEIETIDLAGRTAYGASTTRRRALSILRLLPPGLRRRTVALVLARRLKRLKPEWEARLEQADAVIIGGGNLFQDDDLNFPLKVGTVLDLVRSAGKPLAVFAVGVTGQWSTRAERLFRRLLQCRLVHVSVRDHGARENWITHFGSGSDVEVCPDPGLLARDLLADDPLPCAGSQPIGVCVTHPLVLSRHAGIADALIPLTTEEEYRQLVHHLIKARRRVLLFTNGADEDRHFLERVLDDPVCKIHVAEGTLSAAPHPGMPQELAETISQTAAVIAHRLHASIIAYALAIPAVGLGWDRKVEKFFELVGRDSFFLQGRSVTPQQIAALAIRAAEDGIDMAEHTKNRRSAKFAVARLAEQLRAAGGRKTQWLPDYELPLQ